MQTKNTLRFGHLQQKFQRRLHDTNVLIFTQTLGASSGCNQESICKEWWGTINKKSPSGDGVYIYLYSYINTKTFSSTNTKTLLISITNRNKFILVKL